LTFDGEERVHHLHPADRGDGATMNRFGVFPYRRHGGGPMEIYFDDLAVTR
jgi:hypothetical protein